MYIVYQLILSSTTFLFASYPLIPLLTLLIHMHLTSIVLLNSPMNYPWHSSGNPIFCSSNVQSLSWSLSCLFSTLELTTALEIVWVLHWIKSFLNYMLYQASHFSKSPSLVISPSICHSDFELYWYPYEPLHQCGYHIAWELSFFCSFVSPSSGLIEAVNILQNMLQCLP